LKASGSAGWRRPTSRRTCTRLHAFATGRLVTELSGYHFETATGAKTVIDTMGVLNLQGFGLANSHPALGPAGALVYYATENLCAKPENLRGLQEYRSGRMLLLDPATLRNLEVFRLGPRWARRHPAGVGQPDGDGRRCAAPRALAGGAHPRAGRA
jgi:DNA mismatch repair ATPase MutS